MSVLHGDASGRSSVIFSIYTATASDANTVAYITRHIRWSVTILQPCNNTKT